MCDAHNCLQFTTTSIHFVAAGVTELACLAHVRRKFFEIDAANPHPMCHAALAHIAEPYAIEQQAKNWDAVARAFGLQLETLASD